MQLDFNFVQVKAYMGRVMTGSDDTLEGYLKIYTPSGQKKLQEFFGRELPRFKKIQLTKKEVEHLWNSAQKGEFAHNSFLWGTDYKENKYLEK